MLLGPLEEAELDKDLFWVFLSYVIAGGGGTNLTVKGGGYLKVLVRDLALSCSLPLIHESDLDLTNRIPIDFFFTPIWQDSSCAQGVSVRADPGGTECCRWMGEVFLGSGGWIDLAQCLMNNNLS